MDEIRVKATIDVAQAKVALDKLNAQVKDLSTQMKTGTITNKQYANSFNSLTKGLRSYISAYAAIHYGKDAIETLRQTELGFIAIQKTTNLAGAEMDSFKQGLINLANELKGSTVLELQSIATIAGQLGISGKDDLLTFTKAIAKIAVATDLTAQDASQGFARITKIMGEPISKTEQLGSVMNELSNTTTATASDIVAYSYRLAGSAKTLGLTTDQVFALSATLRDIGTRVEGGGTAMSRLMNLMIQDTQAFAYYSGKTLEQYQRDMEDKPMKAIQDLISSLSTLSKEAKMDALQQLGITSEETVAVMLKLTTAQGTLTKNLKTAREELIANKSLQREYALASESLDSSIKDLNDSFVQLMITLGEDLLPFFKDWIKDTISVVDATKEFYSENKIVIQSLLDLLEILGELYLLRKVFTILFGAEALGALISVAKGVKTANDAFSMIELSIEAVSGKIRVLLPLLAKFGWVGAVVAGTLVYVNKVEEETAKYKKTLSEFGAQYAQTADLIIKTNKKIDGNFFAGDNEDLQASQEALKQSIQDNLKEINDLTSKGVEKYATQIGSLKKQNELATVTINKLNNKIAVSSDYGKYIKTFSDRYNEATNEIKMTSTQLETFNEDLKKSIKAKEDDIAQLEKSSDSLDENSKKLEQYKNERETLITILEKTSNAHATIERSSRALFQSELAQVEKLSKGYIRRRDTQRNALDTMIKKEKELKDDVAKLQKELSEIIKKYQDQRVQAVDAMNDKIRNAEQKGMTDIQKYQNDQLIAEQKYNKASSSLKSGNLEEAKRYLEEYYALIENYAGDEISIEKEIDEYDAKSKETKKKKIKEVQATRTETLAEYRRDVQQGNDLELKLIAETEAREVKAQNEKIKLKIAELEVVKQQLAVQIQYVKLLEQAVSSLTSAKTNIDLTDAENSLSGIDGQIDTLKDKLRDIKVGADTTQAQASISQLSGYGKKTINNVTVDVTADTTPADFGIEKLITKTEGDEVSIGLNPQWEEAQKQLDKFRTGEEKDTITQKFSVDATDAKVTIKSLQSDKSSKLKINVDDTVAQKAIANLTKTETKIIKVKTVTANSTGGLIGKYSTGGIIKQYADGGFTRQSGKIAGHDLSGSDDVKALLTRGEFVQNVRAVDYYGVEFMKKLNSMQIPKANIPRYASGGLITPKMPIQKYSTGGSVNSISNGIALSDKVVTVNFNIGGNKYPLMADESVANALAKFLDRNEF